MFRFYALRVLKDYLGHVIFIGLPLVLIYVNMEIQANAHPDADLGHIAFFMGIGFILMFQIFGAAYTTEGMEGDFFTSFKDRLRASPVHPVRFMVTNMFYSSLVSFLQLMLILAFIFVIYEPTVSNWGLAVLVIFLGVGFTQTLGAVVIILVKKANKAQAVITLYAIGGSILAGHIIGLPDNAVINFLKDYASPISWQRISIEYFVDGDYAMGMLGIGLLLGAWAIILMVLLRMSRRVIA